MIASNYYAYKNEFKKLYGKNPIVCEKYLDSYYLKFYGNLDKHIFTNKILLIVNNKSNNHFRINWIVEAGNPFPIGSQIDLEYFQRLLYGIAPESTETVEERLELIVFDLVQSLHRKRENEILSLRSVKS